MENALVQGAAGYRDFIGTLLPGLERLPAVDGRGELTIICIGRPGPDAEPVVVPASTVRPLSADEQARIRGARLYRAEWAVKTGRPERAVYIPTAIRPLTVKEY